MQNKLHVILLCLKYALIEKTHRNENVCKNMHYNFLTYKYVPTCLAKTILYRIRFFQTNMQMLKVMVALNDYYDLTS